MAEALLRSVSVRQSGNRGMPGPDYIVLFGLEEEEALLCDAQLCNKNTCNPHAFMFLSSQ